MTTMMYSGSWKILLALFCLLLVGCSGDDSVESSSSDKDIAYCPYFDNRLPQSRDDLVNCSWYSDNCCCTQGEIDVLFDITAPSGANNECRKWLNYLMCWVCSPKQHLFLKHQILLVCDDFCNNMFNACRNATLEEVTIGELNSDGVEFCRDRKFEVRPTASGNCFNFDPSLEIRDNALIITVNAKLMMSIVFTAVFFIYIS